MKLYSWNVNGIRACVKSGAFQHFVEESDADVICLQEVKARPEQCDLELDGYHCYWNPAVKAGYSGTAIFSREEPIRVTCGINQPQHDNEGRVLTAEYDEFYLVNVYTPNSQDELRRLEYRMEWEDAFRAYVLELDESKPVLICGDLNVAHAEIDLKNPRANRRHAGFTDEERGKLTELLECGFVDTFRHFFPETVGAYTWWSYIGGARGRNAGWRIDYFLASERFVPYIELAAIHQDVMGSDHCPVQVDVRRN